MKVAIIGAGAAGLVSLKYGLDEGHDCDVYEKTGSIGGVWVYHEEVVDKHGFPVSSMYKGLRSNLPKETMNFLDFPYPQNQRSFIPQEDVLDYFQKYASHFDLERKIKFHRNVTQLKPLPAKKWSVTVENVQTNKEEEPKIYDAVFVCNGHYNKPKLPDIPGRSNFKGTQFHSVYYRKSDDYKDKRVLIIGGFSSGTDIARLTLEVSPFVYVSYRGELLMKPPAGVIAKPEVSRLEENGAVFVDGSTEQIDIIIYCTGYLYDFPFLAEDCGIQYDDKWVRPLYKHIVNIEHPTMYFIGVPFNLCVLPMMDIQARFALAALSQHFCLPSKEEMMKELDEHMANLRRSGAPISNAHRLMGPLIQKQYFDELASTARIKPIPNVVNKIFALIIPDRHPSRCFTVIDDENVIETRLA